jgi:FtsH-binding integral membrane protein
MKLERDEYGIPREVRPPRKWLGYLLAGTGLASGIGQMYWAVSIASTQMVGVYQRWTHDNEVPLLPCYVAWIVSIGLLVWLARGKQDKYSKAEKRVLFTALILAMTLGAIGFGIISLIEPYCANCDGGN